MGTVLVWTVLHGAPMAAASTDSDTPERGWDARVDGTGSQGMQVRQGPVRFSINRGGA